jgi:tetrahydromethanopterin S-methyltransferase subunit F
VARHHIAEESAIRLEYSEYARFLLALDVRREDDLTVDVAGNVILKAIEDYKNRVENATKAEVDIRLAEARVEIAHLKSQLSAAGASKDEETSTRAATEAIREFDQQITRKEIIAHGAEATADVIAAGVIIAVIFVCVLGAAFLALRDFGVNQIFSYQLDSTSSAYLRLLSSIVLTFLGVIGLSFFGLFRRIRDFVKIRCLYPLFFR